MGCSTDHARTPNTLCEGDEPVGQTEPSIQWFFPLPRLSFGPVYLGSLPAPSSSVALISSLVSLAFRFGTRSTQQYPFQMAFLAGRNRLLALITTQSGLAKFLEALSTHRPNRRVLDQAKREVTLSAKCLAVFARKAGNNRFDRSAHSPVSCIPHLSFAPGQPGR